MDNRFNSSKDDVTKVYAVLPAPDRDPLEPGDGETGWEGQHHILLSLKHLQSRQPLVLVVVVFSIEREGKDGVRGCVRRLPRHASHEESIRGRPVIGEVPYYQRMRVQDEEVPTDIMVQVDEGSNLQILLQQWTADLLLLSVSTNTISHVVDDVPPEQGVVGLLLHVFQELSAADLGAGGQHHFVFLRKIEPNMTDHSTESARQKHRVSKTKTQPTHFAKLSKVQKFSQLGNSSLINRDGDGEDADKFTT